MYWVNGPPSLATGEWRIENQQGLSQEFGLRVTVIPEPAAAALMLVASVTLLTMRRRTSL